MGKLTTTGAELAPSVLSGVFTGTGNDGTSISINGPFNFFVQGGSGTVVLQASYDGGTTWIGVPATDSGTTVSVNTATAAGMFRVTEVEPGVLYRANCTAYTSGSINYRISGGARLT